MKNNHKILCALLALALLSLPLFASGAMEKGTDYKSLDLSTASVEEMEKAWNYSVTTYESQRESLRTAMDEAIKSKDVNDYLELRTIYRGLVEPEITKEDTEILTKRILNASSEEEKKALSTFLYDNSPWYRPQLTFEYSIRERGMERTVRKTFSYRPGTEITVPGLEGDGIFLGWSIDGESVAHKAGDTISMPYSNTTFQALFSSGISFSDVVTGHNSEVEGTTASLPLLEGGNENLVFLGWYGEDGKKVEGEMVEVEEGKSASYEAYWKGVEIGDGSIRYYEDGKIPAETQVLFSFPISNIGNVGLRNLKVSLESEDVKILTSSLRATILGEGSVRASFVLYTEGEKGQEKTVTANIEDSDGNKWSKDFTFLVQ